MVRPISFSLDESNIAFVTKMGGDNKSAYVNELIQREKRKALEEAFIKANEEAANDPDCIEDMEAFSVALLDGLDD